MAWYKTNKSLASQEKATKEKVTMPKQNYFAPLRTKTFLLVYLLVLVLILSPLLKQGKTHDFN